MVGGGEQAESRKEFVHNEKQDREQEKKSPAGQLRIAGHRGQGLHYVIWDGYLLAGKNLCVVSKDYLVDVGNCKRLRRE